MTGAGAALEYVHCPFCDFKAPTKERVKEHAIGWCKEAIDGLTLQEMEVRLNEVEQNSDDGAGTRHPDGAAAVDELPAGQDLAVDDDIDRQDDETELVKECPWCERTFKGKNAGNALGGHKSGCKEKPPPPGRGRRRRRRGPRPGRGKFTTPGGGRARGRGSRPGRREGPPRGSRRRRGNRRLGGQRGTPDGRHGRVPPRGRPGGSRSHPRGGPQENKSRGGCPDEGLDLVSDPDDPREGGAR